MATVPEGYVELDLVGFTDKGTYSSSETYVKNDLVHNDNKIYLSLQDDNIGQALPSSTETENTYWKVWLAGSADDLANITVKDTSNVTGGGANKVVVAQNLIDAIANKVIQNMNSITQLNSNLESITGSSPTGGKSLKAPGGSGNCSIWHNSSDEENYGSVIGDYNSTVNTELLICNGKITLKITRADQTTEEKVIASIDP